MELNAGLWRWAVQANRKRELQRLLLEAHTALEQSLQLANVIDELSPEYPARAAAGLAAQGLEAGWSSEFVEKHRSQLQADFQNAVDARRSPLVTAAKALAEVSTAVETLVAQLQLQDGHGPTFTGHTKNTAGQYFCIAAASGAARWGERAPELRRRVTGTLLAYAAIALQLEPVPVEEASWKKRRPAWDHRLRQARSGGTRKHPLLTVRGKVPTEQRRRVSIHLQRAIFVQAQELLSSGSDARAWDLLAHFTPRQIVRKPAREKVRRWE
ncbi:MAG: hypothetical protein QM723_13260 [Myxococcaceae bacterium]